jgi:hypothetical protein
VLAACSLSGRVESHRSGSNWAAVGPKKSGLRLKVDVPMLNTVPFGTTRTSIVEPSVHLIGLERGMRSSSVATRRAEATGGDSLANVRGGERADRDEPHTLLRDCVQVRHGENLFHSDALAIAGSFDRADLCSKPVLHSLVLSQMHQGPAECLRAASTV